ncbi:hypothetical protein U2A4042360107 [Corynebacterium striatum]|nr:hypothetical protein U2A4042360107 [Corynebacterium striatum]
MISQVSFDSLAPYQQQRGDYLIPAEKAVRTTPQGAPPRRPSPSRTRLDLAASAATLHTFAERLVATRAMKHRKVAPGAHLTPFARRPSHGAYSMTKARQRPSRGISAPYY